MFNLYFFKSKGHNSVKKCSTIPKFELELDFIVLQLYTKFQYNMYNGPKENERKPFLH